MKHVFKEAPSCPSVLLSSKGRAWGGVTIVREGNYCPFIGEPGPPEN